MPRTRDAEAAGGDRLRALDGLRGLAAVVVVFYHLTLIRPSTTDLQLDLGASPPPVGTLDWFLLCTPLRLATSGTEAVVIFFVLSGFVLTRAVADVNLYDWATYYPRRLARLLLPTLAAILVAAVIIAVAHESPERVESLWLRRDSIEDLTPQLVVAHLDLVTGPTSIDNPVWSLRYELLFSLLLPIYVILAGRLARTPVPAVVATLCLVALGTIAGSGTTTYLPMFLIGSLLGSRPWLSRLGGLPALRTIALLAGSLVLLDLRWVVWSAGVPAEQAIWVGTPASVLGAAGLVVVASTAAPVARVLASRPAAYLGGISFSLYLVHVPVIFASANVLSGGPLWLIAGVALVGSAVLAVLFSKFIERPAHDLSRRIGRSASAELRRPPVELESGG